MQYKLTKPCYNCPFLREGGIRLHPARAREIAQSQLDSQGGTFPCHKTVDYDAEDGEPRKTEENYCAGALIFAEKHNTANQLLRIMMRLGAYNPDDLDKASFPKVFDSMKEMLTVNRKANV